MVLFPLPGIPINVMFFIAIPRSIGKRSTPVRMPQFHYIPERIGLSSRFPEKFRQNRRRFGIIRENPREPGFFPEFGPFQPPMIRVRMDLRDSRKSNSEVTA